jgi:hypothetical protein
MFSRYKNGDSSSITFRHRFGPQIVSGIIAAVSAPIIFGVANSDILEGLQTSRDPIRVSCANQGAPITEGNLTDMAWFGTLSLQDVCGEMDSNGGTDVYWDEGNGN